MLSATLALKGYSDFDDRNRFLTLMDLPKWVRFVITHCQSTAKVFSSVGHETICGSECVLL